MRGFPDRGALLLEADLVEGRAGDDAGSEKALHWRVMAPAWAASVTRKVRRFKVLKASLIMRERLGRSREASLTRGACPGSGGGSFRGSHGPGGGYEASFDGANGQVLVKFHGHQGEGEIRRVRRCSTLPRESARSAAFGTGGRVKWFDRSGEAQQRALQAAACVRRRTQNKGKSDGEEAARASSAREIEPERGFKESERRVRPRRLRVLRVLRRLRLTRQLRKMPGG